VEPRIMKAIPVHPSETVSPAPKARPNSKPPPKAIPTQRQKTD
jgi:hypothetical protein